MPTNNDDQTIDQTVDSFKSGTSFQIDGISNPIKVPFPTLKLVYRLSEKIVAAKELSVHSQQQTLISEE
ncbi:hypothetical protein HY988_02510 [Candidatus Micrarchaeota archaeon]|nr:hypothetical protein [Candidatus Micrarchaeota archaeon]